MTQTAVVTGLPVPGGDGTVEVTVLRRSACGHSCEGCGGCGRKESSMAVRVKTGIPLELGDRVELSGGGNVPALAALVYLTPVALFLLGYLLPAGFSEGPRCLCGGLGFALGVGLAVLWDRRLRRSGAIRYQIVRKL